VDNKRETDVPAAACCLPPIRLSKPSSELPKPARGWIGALLTDYTQVDAHLDDWVSAHQEEIVAAAQGLLRIPSVKGEPAPDAPFGAETRRALDYALQVAETQGLTTKMLEGYVAHAEWAAPGVAPDAPIVGVLAHVDVVPAGDGWTSGPFDADIVNGRIVARGAIDDKGPAIAGLFAIAALKDCGASLTRRMRLILGADEESGFGCVRYYFAHEEMPVTGFTPDADFPLVHAEKGIANAVLVGPAPPEGQKIHIVRFEGGLRPNMVPDSAEALLDNVKTVQASLARLNGVVGIEAMETKGSSGQVRVAARGVSAHGSTPEKGVNALSVLCDALLLLDHHEDQVDLIENLKTLAQDTTGACLGIAGADAMAGPLTCNLGLAGYKSGQVTLTFNIRYPVTWNKAVLEDKLQVGIAGTRWTLQELTDQAPLYVPTDDLLAQTLLEVYRAETSDMRVPLTMGGGTYARAMTKGVAFGASFPGANTPGPHEKNEAWAVTDLIRATKIYAKALVRLGNQ